MRKLLRGRFPMAAVRELASTAGVERARWRELAQAGVFALRLPETEGGAGLGMAEAALVFEELGRALVPGPLVASHVVAGAVAGAVWRPGSGERSGRGRRRPVSAPARPPATRSSQ